jgi:hypothetical protein
VLRFTFAQVVCCSQPVAEQLYLDEGLGWLQSSCLYLDEVLLMGAHTID